MKLLSFLKYKFSFKKNKKVDLLLFDDPPVKFNFKDINFSIYYNNEINIYYLIIALVKFLKSDKKNLENLINIYFINMIKSFDPILTIGKDRFGKIIKFHKFFPQKKKIFYEWAYSFNEQISISQNLIQGISKKKSLQHKNKNYEKNFRKKVGPDYYFVMDKRSKKFIEKVYKSKFLIAGSVRNNEKLTNNFKKKDYDFLFISSFRPNAKFEHLRFSRNQNIIDCTIFAIKAISSFCEENNKKLCIALASNREEKSYLKSKLYKAEMEFYKKYAKKFFTENLDSYSLSNKSKIIINTHSNLGYEMLARKKKVFFINNLNNLNWHFFGQKNKCFIYKGKNSNELKKKLKFFINMKTKNYLKLLNQKNSIMQYDMGNIMLKKLIKNILHKEKKGDLLKL